VRKLQYYFSDRRLVALLCRKRIALARKNRRVQFVARASGGTVDSEQDELQTLLPPRGHWPRPRRRARCESPDPPATVAKTLAWHVLRVVSGKQATYSWAKRLRRFLDDCRHEALSWDRSKVHKARRVVAIPKERPGNGQTYRVVVTYSLRDSLIASGFAAYLGAAIDGALDDCCFAFRPVRNGEARTHHDAVDGFRVFASQIAKGTDLWVAECDIQGFFDSVPHKVARARLRAMAAKTGTTLDERAIAFLRSFLTGYNYASARKKAIKQLRVQHVDRPILFDPDAALADVGDKIVDRGKRGIPQGSPLSGVLANAILAAADERCVKKLRRNGRSHYARYCDDVLLVSTNRESCRSALDAYVRKLGKLGLAHHPPHTVRRYWGRNMRRFWEEKSKLPYRWRSTGRALGVPWVGFLGYQFKRDGTLRIRQASIRREIAKQRKIVDDVLRSMQTAARAQRARGIAHKIPPTHRIEHKVRMHLVAIGVGYPSEHGTSPSSSSLSWCKAYPLLRSGPVELQPLKDLDRGRTSAMKALRGRLTTLVNTSKDIVECTSTPAARRPFGLHYVGHSLSYHGQFLPARRTTATPVTPVSTRGGSVSARAKGITPKRGRHTCPR